MAADARDPKPVPGDIPDDKLLETLYQELRTLAEQRLRKERENHTLQATALVHEVWLRLRGQGNDPSPWANEAHFFAAAAEAMRRILIDHARSRARHKRGGKAGPDGHTARRVPLDVLDLAREQDPFEILALEDSLRRLEALDSEAFGVVRLRFFAGLTRDEAAAALDISPRQADRAWAYARAWLQRDLDSQTDSQTEGGT